MSYFSPSNVPDSEGPRKRRKTEQNISLANWKDFERDVRTFEVQHVQGNGKFAFGFVEGPLIKALRLGYWYVLTAQFKEYFHSL